MNISIRRLAVLVGLLVGLADVADGKVLRGVIKLSGELPEAYISKFSINEEGYIEGALKTVNGHPFNTGSIALFLYDADDWSEYLAKSTCMERATLAKSRFAIGDGEGGHEATTDEQLKATYQLRQFRESFNFKRKITPETGEVLYIVIADCSLEQIYHDLPEIQYEVTLLNGESHIPAEEYGMLTVHTILLVFLAGGGVFGSMQLREQQNALGSLHLVSKLLAGAYAMNLLATVLQTAYLYAYLGAGEGPEIVDAVAELLQATFTTIVNFVLLALACGWTLTESSTGAAGFMVALRDPGSLISWVEVGGVPLPVVTAAPSALLVLFLTSLFVVLEVFDVATSSREHSSGKFHDHESTAGTVLMIVQVLFCALFLYSVTSTMPLVNPRQRDFLVTLGVTGALWFMVTPTLVVVSVVMPKVLRHRLVTGGAMALQSTALCLMCRLFLTRSSDYYKISSIANAGTLVGINMNSPTKAPEKSKYTD
eukprot:m.125894 g.125894  ORF g.125894 m.125894 type:complete len:483 (+) comp13557_c0_seq1:312-1760(+)